MSAEPAIITTVLGSCVSVCLYDARLHIGGMNHYQMPIWDGRELASPKYGNIAIERLIEKMMDLGSSPDRLIAKVFGGGQVLQSSNSVLNIGKRNIEVGQYVLEKQGISIVASDVGGHAGRKLIYNTESGVVMVKRLKSSAAGVQ